MTSFFNPSHFHHDYRQQIRAIRNLVLVLDRISLYLYSVFSILKIGDIFVLFFVAPRSGLAWKYSIDVGAGVIDADYRGPVGVILFNHSDVDFEVKVGDRIAQLIIEKIITPEVVEVEDLDSTERGVGGFGSTGV